MKVSSRKLLVTEIALREDYEHAVFRLHGEPDNHTLHISSSYGEFSYKWCSPGPSFTKFLSSLDISYVGGKMVGRSVQFDPDATREEIVRYIKEEIDDDETREWELDLAKGVEDECSFHYWREVTDIDCADEMLREKPGPRAMNFRALYKRFWSAFSEELKCIYLEPTDNPELDVFKDAARNVAITQQRKIRQLTEKVRRNKEFLQKIGLE